MAEKAYFEYKGINSADMYLRIENDISFPSPEADIEFVEVQGKDGELAIDHKRLKGETFPIPVQLRLPEGLTVNEQATKISNWLKDDIGWFPLRFSGQPGFHYIAIMHQRFDIKETLKRYGKTVITFKIKPYKMKDENSLFQIEKGQTLINTYSRSAKPYLKITGTGDIKLTKNGEDWLILTGIEDFIEIDSEAMSAYKPGRPLNDKMNGELTPMFPLLEKGENKIDWTGNVEKIEINPRWEVIV